MEARKNNNYKFIEYNPTVNTPEECLILGAIDIKQKVEDTL